MGVLAGRKRSIYFAITPTSFLSVPYLCFPVAEVLLSGPSCHGLLFQNVQVQRYYDKHGTRHPGGLPRP